MVCKVYFGELVEHPECEKSPFDVLKWKKELKIGTAILSVGDKYFGSVRVFERYSYMGGNRVSLNVTLFGNGDTIQLSAITSGGSQAMFFKINTFGEEAFLDKLREIL